MNLDASLSIPNMDFRQLTRDSTLLVIVVFRFRIKVARIERKLESPLTSLPAGLFFFLFGVSRCANHEQRADKQ